MFGDPPPIHPLLQQDFHSLLASADQIPTYARARTRGHLGGRDSGDRIRRREEVLRLSAGTVESQTVMLIYLEGWDGDESET